MKCYIWRDHLWSEYWVFAKNVTEARKIIKRTYCDSTCKLFEEKPFKIRKIPEVIAIINPSSTPVYPPS